MTIVPPPLAPPLRKINPPQWSRPSGSSHAMVGTGTFVFVGGQIATDDAGRVTAVGLVPQHAKPCGTSGQSSPRRAERLNMLRR